MDSSQKLTNTDVKKLNKNRIFRLIYNSDKISRQEIADQLGLSLPTVNQNLKMLMEDELIEYVGNFTSTGGRRAQAITINNNARKAISVNIKADYINVDVVGLKGQIIYSMAVKAHFSKSSAYIEKITDAVRHAVDYVGADADDILGVGITVPGILDDEKQIHSLCCLMHLRCWRIWILVGIKLYNIFNLRLLSRHIWLNSSNILLPCLHI